jgi:hypothetical protein
MAHRSERLQQIKAMVDRHDGQLRRVVRARGSRHPEVVDGACTYAWLQLLAAEHVDLRPPLWEALAWLTSCAVRYARMLDEIWRHVEGGDGSALAPARTVDTGSPCTGGGRGA